MGGGRGAGRGRNRRGSWYMVDEVDLAALVAHHACLLRLCGELEAIADRLPTRPTAATAGRLREELVLHLPAQDRRDRVTLDHIFVDIDDAQPGNAVLAGIAAQRMTRLVEAQDIASALASVDAVATMSAGIPDRGAMPVASETLGYMLRGFFQSCRQAIAFEELAILHLAAARLTAEARSLLIGGLALHCTQ